MVCILYLFYYIGKTADSSVYSIIYSISLSYIAAFIFYIFQIVLNEYKRTKSINKVVKSRLGYIIKRVDKLYGELIKLYANGINIENELDSALEQIQSNFSLNDISSVANISKIRNIGELNNKDNNKTIRDLIYETIYVLDKNSEFLYKTFPEFLPEEIIDLLENMKDSRFVSLFSLMIKTQPSMDLHIDENCTNLFKDFWELNEKLKELTNNINCI